MRLAAWIVLDARVVTTKCAAATSTHGMSVWGLKLQEGQQSSRRAVWLGGTRSTPPARAGLGFLPDLLAGIFEPTTRVTRRGARPTARLSLMYSERRAQRQDVRGSCAHPAAWRSGKATGRDTILFPASARCEMQMHLPPVPGSSACKSPDRHV